MKLRFTANITVVLATALLACPTAWAKKNKGAQSVPTVQLNEAGQKLEAQYAAQLSTLKQELTAALPTVDDRMNAAYLKAREDEATAIDALEEVKKRQDAVKRGQGLVAHAKGTWIRGAEKNVSTAEADLKAAKTDEQKQAAQAKLESARKNLADGEAALKERQAALDLAIKDQPAIERDMKAAQSALDKAKANTLTAMKKLGLSQLLTNDQLDAKLVKYTIIAAATPNRLAAFAEKGNEQQAMVERLLSDAPLMIQMAVADGANGGEYAAAIEIYTNIENSVSKPLEGILQRLAVAVALEHAVPIEQRAAISDSDALINIDPVKRFLHYATAYTKGELDPAFNQLTTWDLRMVVDGEEPNKIAQWGRDMLTNYRPDHVTTSDYRWRYAALVRSDVRYGSQDNQYDEERLQFFQNILKNGGICGRRAFIGRFILRSFGIPVTARPQPAHAALAHWTPDGWVVCLGGGWGIGSTKTQYGKDLDFLATTQARATGSHYLQVKRAQWIGSLMGESPVYGLITKAKPGFWYGVSLYTQKALIEASKAKTLAAVGEDIGEANETSEKVDIAKVEITRDDRKVLIAKDGTITIPAAATTEPTQSSGKIIFMNSVLGGKQLHYSRTGGDKDFEYSVKAPKEGTYKLSARVCTPSWQQNLKVSINGSEAATLALPFTVGMWEQSEPVTVELKRGTNKLVFSHYADGQPKGFSIRDFTLAPAM